MRLSCERRDALKEVMQLSGEEVGRSRKSGGRAASDDVSWRGRKKPEAGQRGGELRKKEKPEGAAARR